MDKLNSSRARNPSNRVVRPIPWRPASMIVSFVSVATLASACGSSTTSASGAGASTSSSSHAASSGASTSSATSTSSTSTSTSSSGGAGPFIGSLKIATIGSTVDPMNGDVNPYGLTIAPKTAGLWTEGDLLVCNFNDSANVQGNGTTIVALHPTVGAKPTRIVQDPNLKGCAALGIGTDDQVWAAAYSSNLAPFYTADGTLVSTLSAGPWSGPWGEIFAPAFGSAFATYVTTNATNGSIVRVDISGTVFTTIATGFTLNVGAVPGNILGVSGLTYDATNDTLFVVDSNQNRLVAFAGYSTLGANAIVANADGSFSGPSASSARVVFSGAPLNAPISSAELWNGDIVVGNTADNLLVEITQKGAVVATQSLDTGATGALFGIVTSGTSAADTKIYFNDDNDNTVKVLSR